MIKNPADGRAVAVEILLADFCLDDGVFDFVREVDDDDNDDGVDDDEPFLPLPGCGDFVDRRGVLVGLIFFFPPAAAADFFLPVGAMVMVTVIAGVFVFWDGIFVE